MKGLICNRPAPGLIRIKERSSEVCEFQRPRHLFFFFCRLAITRCLHIVGSFFSTWKPFTAPPSAYGRVVWNDIKATTLKFKCGKWHLLVSQGGFGRKYYFYTQRICSIPCIHCMYLLGEFRFWFSAFWTKQCEMFLETGSESKVWRPVSVVWKLRNTQFVKTKSKSVWAGKYEAASKMSLWSKVLEVLGLG